MEPLNNGHIGDEHFVHCSEVVPSSEVEMYGQCKGRGKQCVHCREVVHSSGSTVYLYVHLQLLGLSKFISEDCTYNIS